MTKKNYISLANMIRQYNDSLSGPGFSNAQLDVLADWFATDNPQFDKEKWINHIYCISDDGKVEL